MLGSLSSALLPLFVNDQLGSQPHDPHRLKLTLTCQKYKKKKMVGILQRGYMIIEKGLFLVFF